MAKTGPKPIPAPESIGALLFKVPWAVPTIRLPLRVRRRVAHDDIERGQYGDGGCQDRRDRDHGFGHATTLMTASASAQMPIHSAITAIAPNATRPMPVIESLVCASILRQRASWLSVVNQRGCLSTAGVKCVSTVQNNISMPRISFCVGVKSNALPKSDHRFQEASHRHCVACGSAQRAERSDKATRLNRELCRNAEARWLRSTGASLKEKAMLIRSTLIAAATAIATLGATLGLGSPAFAWRNDSGNLRPSYYTANGAWHMGRRFTSTP